MDKLRVGMSFGICFLTALCVIGIFLLPNNVFKGVVLTVCGILDVLLMVCNSILED